MTESTEFNLREVMLLLSCSEGPELLKLTQKPTLRKNLSTPVKWERFHFSVLLTPVNFLSPVSPSFGLSFFLDLLQFFSTADHDSIFSTLSKRIYLHTLISINEWHSSSVSFSHYRASVRCRSRTIETFKSTSLGASNFSKRLGIFLFDPNRLPPSVREEK